jgi:hypothetical protein
MYKDLKAAGLTKEWHEDCMKWWGCILVGEKGHWCWDWDELPIDETCKEFEFCHCFNVEKGID